MLSSAYGDIVSRRYLILLVDDSEQVLTAIATCLNRMNFDVLPVHSGPDALNFMRVLSPDAVFLDARMPGVSGIEVLHQVREHDLLQSVPLVLLTESEVDEAAGRPYGCTSFLRKPILLEAFNHLLNELFPFPKGPRQHLRAPMNQRVALHYDDRYTLCHAVTLSEGGVYLRRVTPLPVGSPVAVSIPEDGIERLRLRGEVIYTREISGRKFTMPPGMAIRFTHLSDSDIDVLRRIVSNLLVGDLLAEQIEPVLAIN
jgi:CheY-like chemotaxis protein